MLNQEKTKGEQTLLMNGLSMPIQERIKMSEIKINADIDLTISNTTDINESNPKDIKKIQRKLSRLIKLVNGFYASDEVRIKSANVNISIDNELITREHVEHLLRYGTLNKEIDALSYTTTLPYQIENTNATNQHIEKEKQPIKQILKPLNRTQHNALYGMPKNYNARGF